MSRQDTQNSMEALYAVQPTRLRQERKQKIKKYQRAWRSAAFFWSLLLFICFFLLLPEVAGIAFAAAGIFSHSWLAMQPLPNWYPLGSAVLILLVGGVFGICRMPYSFFKNFLFLRLYKVRLPTFSSWLSGYLRWITFLVMRVLLLLELCYLLIIIQPEFWWLWAALLLSAVNIGLSYFRPIFFFPRVYKCTDIIDEQLLQALTELSSRCRVRVPKFFLIEKKARRLDEVGDLRANAYLSSWGRMLSIILTDRLVQNLSPAETRSILAHELGHHVHHDGGRKLFLNACLLAGQLATYSFIYHQLLTPLFSGTIVPVASFLLLIALLLLLLGLVFFLTLAYSRHCEYQADEFALRLTRDVSAFKDAMLHIATLNRTPLKLPFWRLLGYTHPSIEHRLRHADEFAIRLAA
jgi:STE24 endopeptidase